VRTRELGWVRPFISLAVCALGADDDSNGCHAHGTVAFEYCATNDPLGAGADPPPSD